MAGLRDPFLDPDRQMFLTGLKRTVTLYSRKKLAMPLEWVLTMLTGLSSDPRCTLRLRLRDAAWLILGFFGFRRHSEVVFSARAGQEMGLRRRDVEFLPADAIAGRRVRLFVRRMKNYPFGKGHYVFLDAVTACGVPLYDILWSYAQTLPMPVDPDSPFIQGSRTGGAFVGQPLHQYRSRLKVLMRRYLPHLSPEELRDYSAHSLRRGGVTHAYRRGVHWDLLNVHGSWLGGTAITGYRWPSDEQLCSVTARM